MVAKEAEIKRRWQWQWRSGRGTSSLAVTSDPSRHVASAVTAAVQVGELWDDCRTYATCNHCLSAHAGTPFENAAALGGAIVLLNQSDLHCFDLYRC